MLADPSARLAYRGVKVIVLGASGFIGRWVARALCSCRAQVTLVVRDRRRGADVFERYGIDGDLLELDLEKESGQLPGLISAISPSIVFNLAGYGIDRRERDESAAYSINAELVQVLCEALAGTPDDFWEGQRLVHAGSALEYGAIGGDLNENSVVDPSTLYGRSKLAGTLALGRARSGPGLRGVTARLFTVYGPGEHEGRLLPSLVEAAASRQPVQLTGGLQKRDFTYVEDVAEGLLRIGLVSTFPGSVLNLATGRLTRVRDFVEIAAGQLSMEKRQLKFGAVETRAEEMDHEPVSISRLRGAIEWSPRTTPSEGISRTIRFLGKNPVA